MKKILKNVKDLNLFRFKMLLAITFINVVILVIVAGQTLETIEGSLERDKFMNPQQAVEFGLIG